MADRDLREIERSGDERRLMLERVRRDLCPGCGGPSEPWPSPSISRVCMACRRPGDAGRGDVIPAFWRSDDGGSVTVSWVTVESLGRAADLVRWTEATVAEIRLDARRARRRRV